MPEQVPIPPRDSIKARYQRGEPPKVHEPAIATPKADPPPDAPAQVHISEARTLQPEQPEKAIEGLIVPQISAAVDAVVEKMREAPGTVVSTPQTIPVALQPRVAQTLNHSSLDMAAQMIFDTMLPIVGKMFKEHASYLRVPVWVLIAGHIKNIYESGRTAALYLEPGWVNQLPGIARPDSECEQCHTPFKPRYFGQRFCGDACGKAAYAAQQAVKVA